MSIPADAIVQVNPSLLVPGGTDLELNGVLVIDNDRIPPGAVLPFSNAEDVKSYFVGHQRVGELASIYFRGYKSSPIKPRVLYLARWVSEGSPPYVVGGRVYPTLDELKLITSGSLTLDMGTKTLVVGGLDFSSATSFSAVAEVVQVAMRAISTSDPFWAAGSCTYDSARQAFIIGSTLSGAAAIGWPTGATATALGLAGGTEFPGEDAQTPAAVMDGITRTTTNWVTFAAARRDFAETPDDDFQFAKWANSKGVRFLHCLNSKDPGLLIPGNTTNIGYQIQQLELSGVAGEYGDIDYAVFLMGVAASIDYNRPGGAITTAFKSQDGIAYNVTDATSAAQLEAYGFNYYGDWATANDQFRFHYPGQMFGDYRWVDTYLNAVWLNNALQVALMNGLTTVGRAPYNNVGYTLVRAWMQDPVQRALSAGIIDTGIVLSESQKADINQQAGLDISTSLSISGYYIQIKDPGAVPRPARLSPIINFWYTYGGAIQRLVVSSKAVV